ncbi:MAG: peptidylprolyl isomerase [Deltaproteobacteria bacterium]|nr:peptidylprolyl isomerase [Deltaproteobacteria bacterium]
MFIATAGNGSGFGSSRGQALVAILVAAFVIAGCGGGEDASNGGQAEPAAVAEQADSPALATYNGKSFSESDFEALLDKLNTRARTSLNTVDKKVQYLENHLVSEIVFDEGRARGYDQDSAIRQQVGDLERRLVVQKMMRESQAATVTEDEVRQYFVDHKAEFATDRVRVSHILVAEEELAGEILASIEADADAFAELAAEHSTDRSNAKRGGDLGFFGRGRMVKEFEEAAFGLEEDGQLVGPLKTRFGYHIIRRTGREDGAQKSFDDVKTQIRVRLVNLKRRTATDDFIASIKKKSGLSINADILAGDEGDDLESGEASQTEE